jgi:peroxiredoxin
MKHPVRLFATTAVAVLVGWTVATYVKAKDPSAEVGSAAPSFSLTDTYGAKHSLAEFKGKYVVLEWLNHDCPFVKKHYNSGNMQALQKKYTGKGVVWLSVVSSKPGSQGHYPPDDANKLTQEKKAAPTAVLFDSEGTVGRAYGARTTPQMVVIDPQGRMIYNGAIDDIRSADVEDVKKAVNYVAAALDESMSGREVTVKTSQPYGCSVKY